MRVEQGGVWTEAAPVILPDSTVSAYPLNFACDFTQNPTTVYSIVNPPGVSFVNDPILGAARKVMQITADNNTTLDNSDPTNKVRVQCQLPFVFGPGHTVYLGLGFLFPTAWPVVPAGGWCVLHEFHGPPFNGGSPNAFNVAPGDLLTFGTEASGGTVPRWSTPLLRDTWMDFVLKIHFSRNPMLGYVELWMNTGAGYVQQAFSDGAQHHYYATLATSNFQGFNASQPKHYRKRGMTGWLGSVTNYYAGHKLGSSFAQVAPASH